MIQQNHICIAAPVFHGAQEQLESLLATMTDAPGQADPDNDLVPFGRLRQLHVARFVILNDPSLPDRTLLAPTLPVYEPPYLAFIADFDGEVDALLRDLVEIAATRL